MKNLTKLFVAVALLSASFACTTDVTEDLGVVVGGQTEIVLSLESSRTQLGEKVDGVYPLYWSEGDKVSVNGVVSEALSASAEGKANATFTVNGVVAHPYNIVSPAAEGVSAVTEGCYPVVFPATQTYKAGNVDGNAVVLYGYAEEGSVPTLCHLTGVLRIEVKGEATLSSLTVTSAEGALAGTYDVNCATGALTAQAGASESVTLSFGDGLALSAEATPIYVAVPAGSYGVVSVKLYSTAGEVMTAQFDTSSKPIVAGMVREFSPITYKGVADSDTFVIDSKEALIAFAANPTKSAVVTADIDMTGYDWTPIEGFAETFDGGNFEIKGLNAPLFGTVSATIRRVRLTDVNIVETKIPNVAAIARYINIPAEVETRVFEDCSASGKIVVDCQGCSPAEEVIWGIAGLVGILKENVLVNNCVNNVEIEVKNMTLAEGTGKRAGYIAGVLGFTNGLVTNSVNNANISLGTFVTNGDIQIAGVAGMSHHSTNLVNNGKVTVSGTYTGRIFIAGVMGYTSAIDTDKSELCTNKGAIEITKDAVFNGATYIGGMAGCTKFSVSDCTNSGDITINGTYNSNTYIAGNTAWAFAGLKTNEITGADNSGDIIIGADAVFKNLGSYPSSYDTLLNAAVSTSDTSVWSARTNPYIAGSIGTSNTALRGTEVSGDIIVKSGAQMAGAILVGGIASYTTKWVEDSEHSGKIEFESGVNVTNNGFYAGCVGCTLGEGIKNVTNRGALNFYGSNSMRLYVGGVVAQSGISTNTVGSEPLCNLKNYGPINLKATMSTTSASTNVGGVACFIRGAAAELYNYAEGAITVAHTASNSNVLVGGLIADMDGNMGKAENYAAVTVDGPSGNGLTVGGIVASHAGVSQRTNQKNTGAVTVKNTAASGISVGGLYGSTVRLTCKNCHNEGDVYVSNIVSAGAVTCGGVAGRLYDATNTVTYSNVTNSGDVYVDASATENQLVHVGGILAWHNHKSNDVIFLVEADENGVGLANSGDITVLGPKSTSDFTVAGIIAYSTKSIQTTDKKWTGSVINSGKINVTKHAESNQRAMIGGIFGVHNKNVMGETATLINTGDITVSGTVKSTDHVGGIVGKTSYGVQNAKCVCQIDASAFPNVGMITGAARDTNIVATNCQIGGSLVASYNIEDEEYNITTLSASNYFSYIYGAAVEQATAEADGCSYISAIE